MKTPLRTTHIFHPTRLGSLLLGSALLLINLTGCSTAYSPTTGGDSRESTQVLELRTRMSKATDVFNRLTTSTELQIPERVVNKARCVAVVPEVLQAAFLAGGKYGRGVVSCRTDIGGGDGAGNGVAADHAWSTPAFITLGGASFGLQAGADRADIVLFFMDEAARRSLVSRSVTLGGDIGVTAGPIGRGTAGATDIELTGIVSYSISQGLFAGMSMQGAVFAPDDKSNTAYYGQSLSMDQLLFGKAISLAPTEAERFLSSLPG